MTSTTLAAGEFFGSRFRSVSSSGFRIDLRIATLPPEEVHSHSHDDAHFVLALDGGYRSLARDAGTPSGAAFGPGALIWNPAGVEHRDCFDEAGGRFLSVSFVSPQGARRGDPVRLFGAAEAVARRLVGATARFAPGDEVAVEGLALDLAARVHDAMELLEDPAPDWVRLAHDVIGDLSSTPGLEVRTVADAVGVHAVSLARRYRRHFGRSPATAIRQARADRAAGLVARGRDLADVADSVGYADQSHMTREFMAFYGLTPARYRAIFS
ncbi:AraC family transcriptional regulator [soil metagenome]